MKFKDLVTKLKEKNEEGKPETTKNFASATPGQPPVVFDTDIKYDGIKIASELDPAGNIQHQMGHALSRVDKDVDGDVDSQDSHTPDETSETEGPNQTMHLLKKGAAERAHTKRLHKAYESTEQGVAEEFINEDQKSEWERIQAMDKGSVTGGKEEVRKKLAYLNAVYAYRQKYKQDTLKVKKEIERINQSKIAEATDQGYWTVVYKDKNGKAGAEKNFDNEASAKKHAERGNAVDKVGGKYHVYHVKGRMDEEVEQIDESEDKTIARLKQLVRFGLMDKSKLPLLTRAIGNLEKGNVTNPTERAVLFDLLNELIGVVTGDDAMFAKVRMSVQNEDVDVSEE